MRRVALVAVALTAVACMGCGGNAERAPSGRVAFALYRDALWRIATINADGTGAVTLLRRPLGGFPTFPAWSPDGTRVAYSDRRGIVVIDADGTDPRRIRSWPEGVWDEARVAWSPDGRRVTYDYLERIVVANADGTKTRAVGHGEGPSWSPDGRTIVYSAFHPATRESQLYLASLDRASTRALGPKYKGDIRDPAWSPDGRQIAYVRASPPDAAGSIHIVGSDGNHDRELGPGEHPSWAPDGRSLVFQRGDARVGGATFRIIDSNGTNEHTLWPLRGPCDCSSPTWESR